MVIPNKSFLKTISGALFDKKEQNRENERKILEQTIILSLTAKELISTVLDAKSDIILGIQNTRKS